MDKSVLLFQLASKGLLVALLAFLIIWSSRDRDKYRKLVWVTLFLTLDVIMFGSFTRLTDSGLGCPDWPGCYGHANPLQVLDHIHAAQALMPEGPVSVMKAWIEMIHRYLAMGIGVLIIAMVAVSWRFWLQSRRMLSRFSPRVPLLLLAFVCLQGAFGAWTVTLKLQPVIVTTHLLLGMTLLGMLTWVAATQTDHAPLAPAANVLRLPAAIALLLLAVQIALGGWVSTNYAALACSDFPLCQGTLMPQMDFSNGFAPWRELGKTAGGAYLPFDALIAIHWTHRSFALVVAACVGWLAYQAWEVEGLRRTARAVFAVLALQIAIGIATVYMAWPLALAVAHNGCAALLVLLLVMLNYKLRIPAETRRNGGQDRPSPVASGDNA